MLQLVRLPFSEIKVDKSFLTNASSSLESRAVTRSIVELGHSLGLVSTAEGIENQETLDFLREIGCDLAQGYHIAKPLKPDELLDWFRNREELRELERIKLLRQSGLIEHGKTRQLDRITCLAARLFNLPSVALSILDQDSRWVKSNSGSDHEVAARLDVFSHYALQQDGHLVIENVEQHPLFKQWIAQQPAAAMRFYAGCPICLPNGAKVGTLELIGAEPRTFSQWDHQVLSLLRKNLEAELAFAPSAPSASCLPDRYVLKKQFSGLLELAELTDTPLMMVLLVLDELGDINRWHGRPTGDRFLAEVTENIVADLDECDLIGRYRGGEMLLLHWDTSADDMELLLDRLNTLADRWNSRQDPAIVPLHLLISSVSIDHNSAVDFESLVEQARYHAVEIGCSIQPVKLHDA